MIYIILGYLFTAIAFLGLLFINPMSAFALFIVITVLIIGPILFIIGVKKSLKEQKNNSKNQKDIYTSITS